MPGPSELAGAGLITAALAPALVVLTRESPMWRRVRLPAPALWAGFLALHTATTAAMIAAAPPGAMALTRVALLAGAVLFWLPVLGPGHCRISGAGRCVYLYLAAPTLDLSAVFIIGLGNELGGLAMIVAMLPIGFIGMALTWQWVVEEERVARAAEKAESGSAPRLPQGGPVPERAQAGPAAWRGSALSRAAQRAGVEERSDPGAQPGRPGAWGGTASPLRATRRGLRFAVGVLWLSAAALQAQPALFTPVFGHDVLGAAADGQPRLLAAPIEAAAAQVIGHPALANTFFVAVQASIGVGVLLRRTARPALLASIAWAAGVWAIGEGLGGLAAGMGSVLAGAPGAAPLYALLGAAAMPDRGHSGRRVPLPRWLSAAWTGLWLLLLLTGPWPQSAAGRNPAGAAAGWPSTLALPGGRPSPGWLDIVVPAALAAAQAFAALGAARPGRPRRLAAAVGGALAVAAWLASGGPGALASGQATDLGTGPPLILLACAVWTSEPAVASGRRRGHVARWPANMRVSAVRTRFLGQPTVRPLIAASWRPLPPSPGERHAGLL